MQGGQHTLTICAAKLTPSSEDVSLTALQTAAQVGFQCGPALTGRGLGRSAVAQCSTGRPVVTWPHAHQHAYRLWCPPLPLSLACMGLLRGLHAGGARVREGTAGEKAGSGGAGEAGALAAAASEKQPLSAQPSTLKLADAVSLTPPARCCCCCCRPASAAASASVSDPRGISSLWSMASAMLADCLREGRGRWVRGEGVRQLALSGRRRRQKPSGCQSR